MAPHCVSHRLCRVGHNSRDITGTGNGQCWGRILAICVGGTLKVWKTRVKHIEGDRRYDLHY